MDNRQDCMQSQTVDIRVPRNYIVYYILLKRPQSDYNVLPIKKK